MGKRNGAEPCLKPQHGDLEDHAVGAFSLAVAVPAVRSSQEMQHLQFRNILSILAGFPSPKPDSFLPPPFLVPRPTSVWS